MSRLFFVPQLPVGLRYQEWWYIELTKHFDNMFDEVIVLGAKYLEKQLKMSHVCKISAGFSLPHEATQFEFHQMDEFSKWDHRDSDVLFLADISFPGIFSNILYQYPVKNAYAFCHATAINAYDLWQPVRKQKWKAELAHAMLYKKVFVGSTYHHNKLINKGWKLPNLSVIRLPLPPMQTFNEEKERDVISVARPCTQKTNIKLEKRVEKALSTKIHRTVDYGLRTWEGYYRFVSGSKVMLITSKEETFGYQVIDALLNNCIPIAPNKYSYPELLPSKFLYDDPEDCTLKVAAAIDGSITLRERDKDILRNCEDFYLNLGKQFTVN